MINRKSRFIIVCFSRYLYLRGLLRITKLANHSIHTKDICKKLLLLPDEEVVGRFGLEGFVEEEGIVPLAEPGTAVVEVPEGDTVNLLAELALLLQNLDQR